MTTATDMLRVYIAGSSRELPRVRAAAGLLVTSGPIILTEPWWIGAEEWAGRDSEAPRRLARDAALSCQRGVWLADVMLMLMPASCHGGSLVELGMAIERGMRIVISDVVEHRTVFASLASHRATSDSAAIEIVARMSRSSW